MNVNEKCDERPSVGHAFFSANASATVTMKKRILNEEVCKYRVCSLFKLNVIYTYFTRNLHAVLVLVYVVIKKNLTTIDAVD